MWWNVSKQICAVAKATVPNAALNECRIEISFLRLEFVEESSRIYSNSSHVQSSYLRKSARDDVVLMSNQYHPSGRYLRTTKGIFFSFSSLIAICSGSVSPSRSTSTGAFMLEQILAFFLSIEKPHSDLICNALVPSTLARSYFVI